MSTNATGKPDATLKRGPITVNQSFSGHVTNPIVDARLSIAMSANQLARQLGLSRQYISRAEQGTYSSLNPALLKWVANVRRTSPQAIEDRYQRFQNATRRATIETVNPAKLVRRSDATGATIFERWRSGYWHSPLAFANGLCVHPDLVTKYEEGITKRMPKEVKKVLEQFDLIDSNWFDEPLGGEAVRGRVRA